MNDLHVTVFDDGQQEEWNDFVLGLPGSNFCHRFEWRSVLTDAYGLECWFLGLRREGVLAAVFPAVRMPGLFGPGASAVSLPYNPYGDLLAASDVDLDRARALCLEFLAEQGMSRVEVRRLGACEVREGEDATEDVTMLLPLPDKEDVLWQAVGPKVRNQVRKAQKSGLTLHWGAGQEADFHGVYADNMGRLGTPVHSRRFFTAMVEGFGPDAEILMVRHEGLAVGGMVLIHHRDALSIPAASTLFRYNSLNPNMLMYWAALAWAVERGVAVFDFGRSTRDSGTYRFKKQWGARPWPLHYRTYQAGEPCGAGSMERYRSLPARMVREAWKRLPLACQVALGPLLRRRTP